MGRPPGVLATPGPRAFTLRWIARGPPKMLRHAISPSYGYVKAAHDIVRHSQLSSDAKLLILYVQGLPERRTGEALSDHAKKLGIKGRAYQKAKGQLKEAGFVHEWRRQGERG